MKNKQDWQTLSDTHQKKETEDKINKKGDITKHYWYLEDHCGIFRKHLI
jgi:hypothetical protein